MKQEIVCPACAKKIKALFPTENPYPGEHVRFMEGEALNDYRCDDCYAEIQLGKPCVAFSLWSDNFGIPDLPWERKYIMEVPHADK